MFKAGRWKLIFAFLAVTAFAAVTGHESVHVDHPAHCKVCHVKGVSPAQLPASTTTAIPATVVFLLFIASFVRPVSSICPIYSGRAPPARSL